MYKVSSYEVRKMDELKGVVRKIIFSADSGGFSVFSLDNSETKKSCTVTINGIAPFAGQRVTLRGCWIKHPRFGMQFKATAFDILEASGSMEAKQFLESGIINGIGPAMAERIIDHFGDQTMDILKNDIDRLLEVNGIGKKSLEKIKISYGEISGLQEIILFLQSVGIPGKFAAEIQKLYGEQTEEVFTNDPYRMVHEISGLSFKDVDKIALAKGISIEDAERITYGINYTIGEALRSGHSCAPKELVFKKAAMLLGLNVETVSTTGEEEIENGHIPSLTYDGTTYIYLPYLYEAETESVYKIKSLLCQKIKQNQELSLSRFERENHITLADKQKEAVNKAMSTGFLIITGGPGTGKTTLIRAIIMCAEQQGLDVKLLAPTGRAAKRLAIASGRDADTIHKALEAEIRDNGSTFFNRNESDQLKEDFIIVDEASMIDISLLYHLLSAVRDHTRVILVGDVDQLPPIGPGNPLKDLIFSEEVPVVRLDHIYRQENGSAIIENAARIRQGEMCVSDDGEFQIISVHSEDEALQYALQICDDERYGVNENKLKMQVLSPMYRGTCGVDYLNQTLQYRLHPTGDTGPGVHFSVGDKVMQKKNDYEKGVYNGDIGLIWAVSDDKIFVHYYDKEIVYEGVERNDIQLAYAVTVHKSQGSEYDTVVFILLPTHQFMLQRNLLYTGVTRARKKTILITTESALKKAIDTEYIALRYTLFKQLLRGEVAV